MKDFLPEGKRLHTRRNAELLCSVESLRRCMVSGEIIEALAVMCDSEHNLIVDLGCMRGVIPRMEGALGIREGTVRDIAILSRVNRAVCFTVTDIIYKDGTTTALLSRARAQRRCMDEYIAHLCPGDIVDARITHMEPFGAFCDIGCGVVALMPIDTISVSRIEHPDERFTVGMDIKAVIKSIDGGRITLSHKELLGTWSENVSRFAVGQTVSGIIRSVENYGAFVELSENLAGLAELKDDLRVGALASVYIKSIIPQKMKVKLIIIDSFFAERECRPPHYFIKSGHIDRFLYSPPGCEKCICTEFAPQTD